MKRIAIDPAEIAADTLASSPRWQARLALGFTDDGGTTRLIERTHSGPLRIQKPLYPEGSQLCHAIIVHPPGGVVGGDELRIRARVGPKACAFVTTPGAAKWYKANGQTSRQEVRLEVADHASLEWLPQETIFFNAAQVELDNSILLGENATYIGGEILCFGRTASGESFVSGHVAQRTSIRQNGKLIWFEQGALSAAGPAMRSPLGLDGKTVCATMIAVGKALPASVIKDMRAAVHETHMFGVTQMKTVVVTRYLGNSSETARQVMTQAWQHLRPALMGRAAVIPRIWNT